MKKTFWIVAILLLSPVQGLYASVPGGIMINHLEPLEGLSFDWSQSGRSLAFHALGQRFELELTANQRLLSRVYKGDVPDDIGVFQGRLAGEPDSWVRLVVVNGVPSGLIWDGEQMLAVEARSSASGMPAPVIYRLQDVYVEPGTMTCGDDDQVTSFAAVYEDLKSELAPFVAEAVNAGGVLNVGLAADYELTQRMGASTQAELLTRINNVDGIFSEQLGVQIIASEIEIFSDPSDPFTAATSGELLGEVSVYRQNSPAQSAQGLTFLFTGRDLEGTTVGYAYRESLCQGRFAAGLAEARRSVTTDTLIAAHEIGHIFGAQHDGQAGSVCESVTGSYLMSPTVNGSDQFSSCSIATMRPFIDAATCIIPPPEADVSIGLAGGDPSNLLLGDSATLEFDVANNGTSAASTVAATFDLPTNVSFDSAAATAGSCSSGAGQVNCALGTIATGGSVRIAIVVVASAVGSGTLNASVSADADSDPGNDTVTTQVFVDPATDLAVRSAGTPTVRVDNTVTIRPTVANLSDEGASNLQLSASFSAGLRVDGADWPGGSCTVSANAINCQLASLSAQSEVALEIRLTATSSGSKSYTATISSSEVDRDQSNNSATGTVTVSAAVSDPGTGSDPDSGGGALDVFWLLLALFVRLRSAGAR